MRGIRRSAACTRAPLLTLMLCRALAERYSLAYCQGALQKKAASLLSHSCQSAVLLLPPGQSRVDGRGVTQETLALSARSFGNFVGLALEVREERMLECVFSLSVNSLRLTRLFCSCTLPRG